MSLDNLVNSWSIPLADSIFCFYPLLVEPPDRRKLFPRRPPEPCDNDSAYNHVEEYQTPKGPKQQWTWRTEQTWRSGMLSVDSVGIPGVETLYPYTSQRS